MYNNLIVIKNISYSYSDGTCPLNGINLSVQEEKTVAIIGAN
jgi:cobalt/nickel transport system ATP-binding protein